jgi:hypothetical protein
LQPNALTAGLSSSRMSCLASAPPLRAPPAIMPTSGRSTCEVGVNRTVQLNRLYYSPVQFKRVGKFIGRMRAALSDLAERLEGLFALDRPQAIADLEGFVGEAVALIEAHLPEIDTSSVRDRLGQRQQPWRPRVPFTPELSDLR